MVARLTGAFVTDPSDASGMNLYDLATGAWSPRILDAVELDPARLPDIRPSSSRRRPCLEGLPMKPAYQRAPRSS